MAECLEKKVRFVKRHNIIGLVEVMKTTYCGVERRGLTKGEKVTFDQRVLRSSKAAVEVNKLLVHRMDNVQR